MHALPHRLTRKPITRDMCRSSVCLISMLLHILWAYQAYFTTQADACSTCAYLLGAHVRQLSDIACGDLTGTLKPACLCLPLGCQRLFKARLSLVICVSAQLAVQVIALPRIPLIARDGHMRISGK